MKILINIDSDTFLLCHEALSMGFALAAFDHEIQLNIGSPMLKFLFDEPNGKLAKMLASLDIYDMPSAWLTVYDFQQLNQWHDNQTDNYEWCSQLSLRPATLPNFESTFNL